MTLQDTAALMDLANRLEVPYASWTFHSSCAPNLIEKRSEHTCSRGEPLVPTPWGKRLMRQLHRR